MRTLYTWTTPNGFKPAILLAELGLPYELRRVDLSKREQKSAAYLSINPNGKIPALVDDDVTVFESGAILQHLAEKHGRFLPASPKARARVLSWLYWQVGGIGPMFGQLHHFADEKPRNDGAYAHFLDEARRLASVLDGQLRGRDFVCDEYSIADVSTYPWVAGAAELMPEALEGALEVRRWLERIGKRPAVIAGMKLEPPRQHDDDVASTRLVAQRQPRR